MIEVIDVFSKTCVPCKSQKPIIEEMAEQHTDIKFTLLDVADATDEFLDEHNIMGVPAILILKDGEKVYQGKGVHPKELLEAKLEQIQG